MHSLQLLCVNDDAAMRQPVGSTMLVMCQGDTWWNCGKSEESFQGFTLHRESGLFLYFCSINGDQTPLPPAAADAEDDAALFEQEPWIEAPIHIDYGTNVQLGANVFINFNCTILDTCLVTIGARTVVGPNVSFFAGTHPLDPAIRNGTKGPEYGKEIHVGEDCWIGGNAIILPGIRIGQGATIGAGSVVTRVCEARSRLVRRSFC